MTRENAREPGKPKDRAKILPRGFAFALVAAAGLVLFYRPRSRNPALAPARGVAVPSVIPPDRDADRENESQTRTLAAMREKPDVRAGLLAAVLAGFFAFVLIAATGLFLFYHSRARDTRFVKMQTFPAPHLQTLSDGLTDPEIARQKSALDEAHWVDRAKGAFEIPIDQAMRAVVARGAEGYDPVPRPRNGGPPQ